MAEALPPYLLDRYINANVIRSAYLTCNGLESTSCTEDEWFVRLNVDLCDGAPKRLWTILLYNLGNGIVLVCLSLSTVFAQVENLRRS
jgi:hypothetical protein